MKFRLLAMTAALVFCVTPWTSAQDQGKGQGTSQKDQTVAAGSSQTDQNSEPAVVPQQDDSKNDVYAIGNRKIGGRGMGNWYSIEGEIRMGKQYAQQVEASVKLVQDP